MSVRGSNQISGSVIGPLQETGDKHGVLLADGKVNCAPGFRDAFQLFGENGWIAATSDPEYGGQGFPQTVGIVVNDVMYRACISFQMAPSLTHGAGHLIESFGAKSIEERFIPNMFAGRWSGTMCLTEPQAGSNLASIGTKAIREGDHFKIKGTKIFITWGDHDLTENVIHLLLARIEKCSRGSEKSSHYLWSLK